jgi:hypothetical protein
MLPNKTSRASSASPAKAASRTATPRSNKRKAAEDGFVKDESAIDTPSKKIKSEALEEEREETVVKASVKENLQTTGTTGRTSSFVSEQPDDFEEML